MNLQISFLLAALRGGCLGLILGLFVIGASASNVLPSNPPWWPDDHHVTNGCYISATAYLAKLHERYPGLEAWTGNVRLPSGTLHTLAIVCWNSRLYLRDTHIGVAEIRDDLQQSFEDAVRLRIEKGGWLIYLDRPCRSLRDQQKEVETAAMILRFAHPKMTYLQSVVGPVTVLSWKTPEGHLAIYEPSLGTAVGPGDVPMAEVATHILGRLRSTVY